MFFFLNVTTASMNWFICGKKPYVTLYHPTVNIQFSISEDFTIVK